MIYVNPNTGDAHEGSNPPAGYSLTFETAEEYTAWQLEYRIVNPLPVPTLTAPVPQMITNAQCRVMLARVGIDPESVLPLINQISDSLTRQETKARWEYANHIYRNEASTVALAAMLGFSVSQLDDLFREAAKIP